MLSLSFKRLGLIINNVVRRIFGNNWNISDAD